MSAEPINPPGLLVVPPPIEPVRIIGLPSILIFAVPPFMFLLVVPPAVHADPPPIPAPAVNSSLTATFHQPGDQIEYTLTIVNKSTVTAAIKSILVDNESVTSDTTKKKELPRGGIALLIILHLTYAFAFLRQLNIGSTNDTIEAPIQNIAAVLKS